MVRRLGLECVSCRLRNIEGVDGVAVPSGEPSWEGIESQLVCIDVDCTLFIDVDDRVEFELRSTKRSWVDPTAWVDGLTLKHGTLSLSTRCFVNPAASLLRVAVLGCQANWDVELTLKGGVPLPDWLEDGFLARALERRLKQYSCEAPLEVDLLGWQRRMPAEGGPLGTEPAPIATSPGSSSGGGGGGGGGLMSHREGAPAVEEDNAPAGPGEARPLPAPPLPSAEPDKMRYLMEAGLPTAQPATAAALSLSGLPQPPPPQAQHVYYQKKRRPTNTKNAETKDRSATKRAEAPPVSQVL